MWRGVLNLFDMFLSSGARAPRSAHGFWFKRQPSRLVHKEKKRPEITIPPVAAGTIRQP
jgi:hypothetical protein